MLEGLSSDNLTKVIMEHSQLAKGCQEIKLHKSSFVLGHMVLMFFKAQKMVLQNKFMTPTPFILLGHCMAH
jgi:hypothetical protein